MSVKTFLLLFSIITSLFLCPFSMRVFSPKSLYDYYKNTYLKDYSNSPYSSKIIDPSKYIKDPDNLYKKILAIESKRHFELAFVVIHEMEHSTFSDKIGVFGDTFKNVFFKNNNKENSLVILFSIYDRAMRISTGKSVRKIISDSTCVSLLDKEKSNLKKEKYDEAFQELLDNILNVEAFEKSSRIKKFLLLLFSFSFLSFISLSYIAKEMVLKFWAAQKRKKWKE